MFFVAEENRNTEDGGAAFLVSVNEGFAAQMLEGRLKSAGIPCFIKGHGGPAGFARYDTQYGRSGADFYVPSELLETAKQYVFDDNDESIKDDTVSPPDETAPEDTPAPGGAGRVFIRAAAVVVLIFLVVTLVDYLMNLFRGLLGYKF